MLTCCCRKTGRGYYESEVGGSPIFTPAVLIVVLTGFTGDRPPQEEFLENLQQAAQALQEAITPVLKFVSGKTAAEL